MRVSSHGPLSRGLSRWLDTVRTARAQSASVTKPVMRTVHAYPTRAKSCWYMIGQVTPPTPEPASAIPIAVLRYLRKYVEIADRLG